MSSSISTKFDICLTLYLQSIVMTTCMLTFVWPTNHCLQVMKHSLQYMTYITRLFTHHQELLRRFFWKFEAFALEFHVNVEEKHVSRGCHLNVSDSSQHHKKTSEVKPCKVSVWISVSNVYLKMKVMLINMLIDWLLKTIQSLILLRM